MHPSVPIVPQKWARFGGVHLARLSEVLDEVGAVGERRNVRAGCAAQGTVGAVLDVEGVPLGFAKNIELRE